MSTIANGKLLELYEERCRIGAADLPTFISEHGPIEAHELLSLVLHDQKCRFGLGECCSAEAYFEQFPELRGDDEAAVAVIYHEYLQAQKLGNSRVSETEILQRFPEHSERLRLQFELHRALELQSPDESASDVTLNLHGDTSSEPKLPEIPGYKIEGVLGQGGMGIVYQARHLALDRIVALKMILAGNQVNRGQLTRFFHEAEAIAKLQHPNIVQVYDVGVHEEQPYLALEYVSGGTLAQKSAGAPQPPPWSARLVESLARAMHVAHGAGCIHRDLKPTNILLTPQGAPKIADFGLARDLDRESTLTRTGEIMGSPNYMAPEQASGHSHSAGPSADIYALGAILYELLTGQPPFQGENFYQALQKVVSREPTPPRRLQPTVPRDLETICLKCLQKQPARRYATAEALADDLNRFLNDLSITARPISRTEKAWRWCRRNPRVAFLSTAVFLLTLSIAIVSSVASAWLRSSLVKTEKSQHEAELNGWESRVGQARANRLSRRPGQRFRSLQILRECVEQIHEFNLSPERLHELRNDVIATLAMNDLDIDKTWPFPPGSIQVGFDGNFERYALTNERGECGIRRTSDNAELFHISASGPKWLPALSRDGRYLLLAPDYEGPFEVWDLSLPQPKRCISGNNAIHLAACPTSPLVSVCLNDGTIDIYELPSGKHRQRLAPVTLWRRVIAAWHPKNLWLAVFSYFHDEFQIRDIATGAVLASAKSERPIIDWHPNGRDLLVAGGENQRIVHFEFDPEKKSLRWRRTLDKAVPATGLAAAFTPSGDHFVANGWTPALRLYDFHTGQLLFQAGNAPRVGSLQFAPTGERLGGVRQGQEEFLAGLRVGISRERRMLFAHEQVMEPKIGASSAVHPRGRLLAASVMDGVGLWDLNTGRALDMIETPLGAHGSVLFEPSGNLLTSNLSGTFRWQVQLGPDGFTIGSRTRLPFPPGARALARSKNGRYFAKPCQTAYGEEPNSGVWLWDSLRPETPPIRLESNHDISSVDFSPDEKWLAVAQRLLEVTLYRLHDDGHVERGPSLKKSGDQVLFSPDGRWLCLGLELVETATWQQKRRLAGPAAFSPDGRYLAISSNEGYLQVLDLPSCRELARFEDPDLDRPLQPVFSPDGSLLIAPRALPATGIQVWDLRRIGGYLKTIGLDQDWPTFSAPAQVHAEPLIVKVNNPQPPMARLRSRPPAEVSQGQIALNSIALSLSPLNFKAYQQRGDALLNLEHYNLALADYQSAHALSNHKLETAGQIAFTCNNRAWELASIPIVPTDPREALPLAERAVALVPTEPFYINTLGIVLYRHDRWSDAVQTLERSLQLGMGKSDGFDLFFLAMAHHKLGNSDAAKNCFDRAVNWLKGQSNLIPSDRAELTAFRKEAERVLTEEPSPPLKGTGR